MVASVTRLAALVTPARVPQSLADLVSERRHVAVLARELVA